MVKELRMNGVRSTIVEIDARCAFCGSDSGWECICVGAILDQHKPIIDPTLLNDAYRVV